MLRLLLSFAYVVKLPVLVINEIKVGLHMFADIVSWKNKQTCTFTVSPSKMFDKIMETTPQLYLLRRVIVTVQWMLAHRRHADVLH
jgi:hypothetical protein